MLQYWRSGDGMETRKSAKVGAVLLLIELLSTEILGSVSIMIDGVFSGFVMAISSFSDLDAQRDQTRLSGGLGLGLLSLLWRFLSYR